MDTADNARPSGGDAQAEHIERIVLVTHAFHMPRQLFAAEGLGVAAAPTGISGAGIASR